MKTKTKTVIEVSYSELDKAITAFLAGHGLYEKLWGVSYNPDSTKACPRAYCFCASEEVGNDTSHEYTVEAEQPESYEMADFQAGEWHYKTGVILNWMCAEGKLEAGEYVVEVCW